MDKEQLLAVSRRYQSAWAAGDWPAWQVMLHPRYSFTVAGARIGDMVATTAWSTAVLEAFPDYSQEVLGQYVDTTDGEGTVVIEAVARGTASGLPPSPVLPAPLEGRRFRLPYVKVLTFRDGLVREDQQYHDMGLLVAQLYPVQAINHVGGGSR